MASFLSGRSQRSASHGGGMSRSSAAGSSEVRGDAPSRRASFLPVATLLGRRGDAVAAGRDAGDLDGALSDSEAAQQLGSLLSALQVNTVGLGSGGGREALAALGAPSPTHAVRLFLHSSSGKVSGNVSASDAFRPAVTSVGNGASSLQVPVATPSSPQAATTNPGTALSGPRSAQSNQTDEQDQVASGAVCVLSPDGDGWGVLTPVHGTPPPPSHRDSDPLSGGSGRLGSSGRPQRHLLSAPSSGGNRNRGGSAASLRLDGSVEFFATVCPADLPAELLGFTVLPEYFAGGSSWPGGHAATATALPPSACASPLSADGRG
jgi:hypothetical protein